MENLQQIADELKEFKGKARGEAFRTRLEYVRKKEGEDGVKELERKMNELGIDIVFDQITTDTWINEGINSLSVVVAKEIFNWSEEDIFNLGRFSFKTSVITRTVLGYFVSMKKALSVADNYWKKYYDFGELELSEFNEKEKYAIIRKKGYKTHPLLCIQHKGYITAGAELLLRNEDILVEETKCAHKESDYHEYKISWKK